MSVVDLIRRCAWCGAVHGPGGWRLGAGADVEHTTHGICDGCFDRLERERLDRRAVRHLKSA